MSLESKSTIFHFVRRLMPNATVAELEEASHSFERYMAIVARVHKRIATSEQPDSQISADCDKIVSDPCL
jgi:hypothetical protein